MQIIDFTLEFVNRTREIINDADKNNNLKYEVSLLINCLVGLIMLPTEKMHDDNLYIKLCVEKIRSLGCIEVKNNDENKLFRALKNAISHMQIEIENENNSISKIIFKDRYYNENKFHTILKFKVNDLKQYALFMADEYLRLRG